jgi:Zn-dependent peptidase ImmA (M78 family)
MITDEQAKILNRHLNSAPVRLGALAKELGIEVFRSTLKRDISGLIEPSDTAPSKYRIKLNRYDSTERQRFTLAHEIAHFLLHKSDIRSGISDDVMYRSQLSDKKEVEANKLAATLVMPDHLVLDAFSKLGQSERVDAVSVLADQFRVSPSAMRIKLGV